MMEALKSYLLTAMIASLASSLLIRITDPRHRSYLRYISGLALLLVVSAPLAFLGAELGEELSEIEFPTTNEDASDDKKEFLDEMTRTMSRQISDLVAEQFGLPKDSVSVQLTLDLSDLSAISICRVDVTVRVECNVDAIDRYLTDSLNCEVTVTAPV